MALTAGERAGLLACLATGVGTGDVPELIACLAAIGIAYVGPLVDTAIRNFINSLLGGTTVACANTHKTTALVQGPGVCCAALAASGSVPVVGLRLPALTKKGKCFVCEVKASTSVKHPGALVFKRGKSHVVGSPVSCPSSSEGCCALSVGA